MSMPSPPSQTYLVGGAVRDQLLGRPVQDLDYVVVGATPQQLLAEGYFQVGRDFPVFLHPVTRHEYALARTERKSGPGYKGFETQFDPTVTLAEDLARRDLTINAMAVPVQALGIGQGGKVTFYWADVVDPYGGMADLKNNTFRHVSAAFSEDPVRLLRVARFAARFAGFALAPETQNLMRHMVHNGEVAALVPERVWQELATGLMEAKPSRMLEVLRDCGALAVILPEVEALWGVPQRADYHPEIDCGIHLMMVLDQAARLGASLPARWACLCHDLGKATTPADVLPRHLGHEGRSVRLLEQVCERLRVPTECRELARVVAAEHGNIHRSADLGGAALLRLLERLDAFRRPERLPDVLLACEADARGRLGFEDKPYPQRPRLQAAFDAVNALDTAQVAQQAQAQGRSGPAVGQAIRAAREHHLTQWLRQEGQG
jgi:tRNA nucleotidyltransferase (CCA-adding enzyme)